MAIARIWPEIRAMKTLDVPAELNTVVE